MKLIIEKNHGDVFAYMESERLYKANKNKRHNQLIENESLNEECDLSSYPNDCYFVFDLGRKSSNQYVK